MRLEEHAQVTENSHLVNRGSARFRKRLSKASEGSDMALFKLNQHGHRVENFDSDTAEIIRKI